MTISKRNIFLVSEIKQIGKDISMDKWEYLFLFFQLIIFADMWKYSRSDYILILDFVISVCLAIRRSVEWKKVLLVVGIISFLMIPPIIKYGLDELTVFQYGGYGLRVMTGCFIAAYYRNDFAVKLENLIFLLACISLPLFLLQCIDPHIYDIFTPLSKRVMSGRQGYSTVDSLSITMHQYFFIYTLNGWGVYRNSGFMWEPAAFGAMLSWALLICMYRARFHWHPRMFVYIITILTTFSLGTYSCAMVLMFMFFVHRMEWKKMLYMLIVLLGIIVLFSQVDLFQNQAQMMEEKMGSYQAESSSQVVKERKEYVMQEHQSVRVNRLAQVYILTDLLLENPFGVGMNGWGFWSANGLVSYIMMWGIPSIIVLIVAFGLFAKKMAEQAQLRVKWYVLCLTILVLIMPMFGNPIYNQVFLMIMLCSPLFMEISKV